MDENDEVSFVLTRLAGVAQTIRDTIVSLAVQVARDREIPPMNLVEEYQLLKAARSVVLGLLVDLVDRPATDEMYEAFRAKLQSEE